MILYATERDAMQYQDLETTALADEKHSRGHGHDHSHDCGPSNRRPAPPARSIIRPPATVAHSAEYDATLSLSSIYLLVDPRVRRLLVELGYCSVSLGARDDSVERFDLPRANTDHDQIRRFKSMSSGIWWYASADTCTCRGYANSGQSPKACEHTGLMSRVLTMPLQDNVNDLDVSHLDETTQQIWAGSQSCP